VESRGDEYCPPKALTGGGHLAKRKIKRTEIKKSDDFTTISSKIVSWCRDNVRYMTGMGVGFVIIVLITGGVVLFKAKREAKARELYQEALTLYPTREPMNVGKEGYASTIAKLQEVQHLYGSTTVATNALVDLGNIYFLQGEYDQAVARYIEFLQRTDATHPLHDQVLESLGQTYEAQELWQAALQIYQRLAKEGAPVYQSQTELYLGRVYEAIGNQDKAVIHYQNYLNGNPALFFGEWIRTKLQRWQQSVHSGQPG
jgi:tetratricopeptide (TPR) repeat protein